MMIKLPAIPPAWSRWLLVAAAVLVAAAMVLPLWGMTLASTQYPEGLRMVVFADHIQGDINEINALNRFIGMHPIADDFFSELRWLPVLFAGAAELCLLAALARRFWVTLAPLVAMSGIALYGLMSMRDRLWQFGHELDPRAPMDLAPFTPPMIGEHQIAQFASYSYFTWGTFLPLVAALLVVAALWLQRPERARSLAPVHTVSAYAA
jgi:copper chaperone NosL